MGDFGRKIDRFIEIFVEQRGYVRVLEGLQNTVMIAVVGLLVGVLIGTLIASVRVMPKYMCLPQKVFISVMLPVKMKQRKIWQKSLIICTIQRNIQMSARLCQKVFCL